MRRFIVAATLAALPAVGRSQARPAGAGQSVNSGVSAEHAGTVTIVNWLGTVRVVGWDRDSVHVAGLASAGLINDPFIVTHTPERGVRVRRSFADLAGGATVSGGSGAAELIVNVPAHSHIVVDGYQTAIDVSGVLGKLELAANVDGAMHVSGSPAELDAYVAGSDIVLDVTTPYLRARTGSGRITWKGSSDDVSLNTVTGLITVNAGVVDRGRFESTSGDIHFSGGLSRTASVTMDTHEGDIVAEFAKGTEAEVIMNAAIMDGFGVHSTNNPDPAKRGAMDHHLGKNDQAVVQINSFKGRARASIRQ